MAVVAPYNPELGDTTGNQIRGSSTGLPHWDDPGAPWDSLKLGAKDMPGVWAITSGECARQVDHKKTKNKDGARIKDLGVLPARFSARGKMVEIEDWEMLQDVMPAINPKKKGGLRSPLSIFHPAIALLGITTIYVERVRVPEIKNGILELSIDMIEWSEPKKAKTSKKAVAKGGYIGTDEDAAILAAQQRNWGLRRGGLSGSVAPDTSQGFPINFKDTTDEDFARLTNGDPSPPSESVASINPTEYKIGRARNESDLVR